MFDWRLNMRLENFTKNRLIQRCTQNNLKHLPSRLRKHPYFIMFPDQSISNNLKILLFLGTAKIGKTNKKIK